MPKRKSFGKPSSVREAEKRVIEAAMSVWYVRQINGDPDLIRKELYRLSDRLDRACAALQRAKEKAR